MAPSALYFPGRTLEIGLRFFGGDEATLTAQRETFSAPWSSSFVVCFSDRAA